MSAPSLDVQFDEQVAGSQVPEAQAIAVMTALVKSTQEPESKGQPMSGLTDLACTSGNSPPINVVLQMTASPNFSDALDLMLSLMVIEELALQRKTGGAL